MHIYSSLFLLFIRGHHMLNRAPKCRNRRSTARFRILTGVAFACSLLAGKASAEPINVVIETRIRETSLSFQPGMKSRQTLTINFDSKEITNQFETGITTLVGADLKSVRDNFLVESIQFAGRVVAFRATGQTASGVAIVPNINYTLNITVDNFAEELVLSGCHDGYPSYTVSVAGKIVYDFQQEFLGALFGECDINIPSTTNSF